MIYRVKKLDIDGNRSKIPLDDEVRNCGNDKKGYDQAAYGIEGLSAEQIEKEILSPQKSRSLRLVPVVAAMVLGDTGLPDPA